MTLSPHSSGVPHVGSQNFGSKPRLLAQLVRCDPVVPFHGDRPDPVRVNRLVPAFPKQREPVRPRYRTNSRRLTDKTRLDRNLLQQKAAPGNFLPLLPVGQDHFIEGVLQHLPALLDVPALRDDLGPLDQLPHVAGAGL